jgi:hypothetical protein
MVEDVAAAVWSRSVNRGGKQVSAIQELADAKTNTIALLAKVDSLAESIAAIDAGGITDEQITALADKISTSIIASLPTPQQIAKAVNDDAAARLVQ